MRFRKPSGTPEATFDLTNMIDVVLLLIIFFMLTAQFAKSNERPMDLPKERGSEAPMEGGLAMSVSLDKDGTITVMEERMASDRLVQLIASDARRGGRTVGEMEITIRADRACPASHLNALVTDLARVGVKKWKLATGGGGA